MGKFERPFVLSYDIETTYVKADVWRPGYNLNIGYDSIDKNFLEGRTHIICVSYKWAHEKEARLIHSGVDFKGEGRLIERFDKIVNKAHIVLAHNGDHFDMKQFNTLRLINKLPPVMWPSSEDTLKMLRKNFKFSSNRLDYISSLLLGKGKNKMSFDDWRAVVELKCPKARKKMFKYCIKDTVDLDKDAKIILPYIQTTQTKLMARRDVEDCSNYLCKNPHIIKAGTMRTLKGDFQKYKCTTCGHNHTGSKPL